MTERLTTEDLAQQKYGRDTAEVQDVTPYDQRDTTGTFGTTDTVDAVDTADTADTRDAYTRDADRDAADRDVDRDADRDVTPYDEQVSEPVESVDAEEPVQQTPTRQEPEEVHLFAGDQADEFRVEWRALQSEFVDEPREAVRRADELVAQVVQNLAATFAEHKRSLEGQWQEGEQVDTEELRLALQRYRSFFDRLLSV